MRPLTPREKDIVDLVVKGLTNREVADHLGVSEKTVKFHMTNIFRKYEVTQRAALIVKYFKSTPENYAATA